MTTALVVVCFAFCVGALGFLCLYVWDAGYRARLDDEKRERAGRMCQLFDDIKNGIEDEDPLATATPSHPLRHTLARFDSIDHLIGSARNA